MLESAPALLSLKGVGSGFRGAGARRAMAPAVVRMVAMPDAFEDSTKPPSAAPRSPTNLLFPRQEAYRPAKAQQDAHINLLTYTREPPTRPYNSTGLAPTELDRQIRRAALLPGPGASVPPAPPFFFSGARDTLNFDDCSSVGSGHS